MARQAKNEVVAVIQGFDYSALEKPLAERLRSAATRINDKVKRATTDLIEVGVELLQVKDALPHGEFGKWLRAEFGWSERTAQNFMNVATRFGPKSEIIADLPIAPTVVYLLAAPSVPDEARQVVLDRAEAGEQITTAVARQIVAEARKTGTRQTRPFSTDKRAERVKSILERLHRQWGDEDLAALAGQLRAFADELESPAQGGKKRRKR